MNVLEKSEQIILLVTISYMMAHSSLLAHTDDIQPRVRWLITVLTRVGLFRVLIC